MVCGFKYILVFKKWWRGSQGFGVSRKERSRTSLGARESKKVFVSGGCGSWPTCAEGTLPPSALHLQLPGPDWKHYSGDKWRAQETSQLPSHNRRENNAMIDLQSNHYIIKRKMSSCEQCDDSLVNSDSSPSAKKMNNSTWANSLSSLPGRVILEKASCPEADQTSQSQILSWLLNGKVRLVQHCVLLANYLFSSFLPLTPDYTIKFQRRSNMPLQSYC